MARIGVSSLAQEGLLARIKVEQKHALHGHVAIGSGRNAPSPARQPTRTSNAKDQGLWAKGQRKSAVCCLGGGLVRAAPSS